MEDYDYVVIGAGSGGLASARRARAYGARVALVEGGSLGGTCVNRGCIPKKILWNAAELAESIADAADYGLTPHLALQPNYSELRRAFAEHVALLNLRYEQRLREEGVDLVTGHAEIVGPGKVRIGDRLLVSEHLLLATGARPWIPAVSGAELGITSDDWFRLERLPERLLVIGGGYVGVEIAGIARALGTRVTLAFRAEAPLSQFDSSIQQAVASQMSEARIELVPRFEPDRIESVGTGLCALGKTRERLSMFDAVLWATGRVANLAGLGIQRIGVELDALGFVRTDGYQNTNVSGVYAVGDVSGVEQLTPLAVAQGRRLADRIFGGQPEACAVFSEVPSVLFSHPPIATVGFTEERARAKYGSRVKVYQSRFLNLYHAPTRRKPQTVIKLVVLDQEERVIGIHVMGRGADELIQGFAVAVRMGAKKSDLDGTLAIHPTAAEELVTMR